MLLLCLFAILVFFVVPTIVGALPGELGSGTASPFRLVVRFTTGLAVLAFVYAWLGEAGILGTKSVAVCTGLAVAAAVARRGRGCLTEWREAFGPLARSWGAGSKGERLLAGLAMAVFALLAVNVLVGAMHPDTGQDSMWYHLALPGQWAITGGIAPSPWVLPSNYALAMESLYAAILTVSNDEVFCVLLYGVITVVLLAAVAVLAHRHSGGRGGVFVAVCIVPLIAASHAGAPVGASNDNFAALALLVSFGVLLEGLGGTTAAGRSGNAALAGFLLGTAVATKLTALAFGGPMVLWFAAVAGLRARSWRRAAGALLLAGAFAALAYSPWAVRGWRGSGDPVFPLATGVFPVRPDYRLVLESSRKLNGLYPIGVSGISEAIRSGVTQKLEMFMEEGDTMVFVMLVVAIAATASAGSLLGAQGILLLSFFYAFFLLKGSIEVIRYYSLAYPLVCVASGQLARRLSERYSRRAWTGLVLALMVAAGASYWQKQSVWVSLPAIQWHFRPILSPDARLRYYSYVENGNVALTEPQIERHLPADARVFLMNGFYPFFLHRECLWGDETVGRGLQAEWRAMPAAGIEALLREKRITHVLVWMRPPPPNVEALEKAGVLRPVPLPEADLRDCRLYRVAENAGQKTSPGL